ncbi:MAG: ATP-binding protein [Candidatus Micrarchaeia archaeon]
MEDASKAYEILALPDRASGADFAQAFSGKGFCMLYDLLNGKAYLLAKGINVKIAEAAIEGSIFKEAEINEIDPGRYKLIAAFPTSNAIDLCKFCQVNALALVCLEPAERAALEKAKSRIEREISKTQTRLSRTDGYLQHTTTQSELYYNSDTRIALLSMLDSINAAIMASWTAYKVNMAIFGEDANQLLQFLKPKMLILKTEEAKAGSLVMVVKTLKKSAGVILDIAASSKFLDMPNSIRRMKTIKANASPANGSIVLGRVMKDGVKEAEEMGITPSTLNLGTIIAGLPGTGKTYAAMGIIEQAISAGSKAVIISPTSEWNSFGKTHGLEVVSLYNPYAQINFFKCDSSINIERFYENLATLLAIASDAGPYTRSLEKVLLGAFQKIYAVSRNPDPLAVYKAVDEEIAETHAKRNNAGIEYTKHGENVRAALQNLRLMLMRPEFAYREGMDMSALTKKGAVFDLSNVSNNMKKFYYALLLNQVYSIAETLDLKGDNELRFILCLEEAQLVLQNGDYTAASIDLMQRIQDFRKRGIGLMLITHNVTDIEQDIRRLCQTKLYFRQSADTAKYAANDLMFDETKEELESVLKRLGHRTCAVNYVEDFGDRKEPGASVILKAKQVSAGKCDEQENVQSVTGMEQKTQRTTIKLTRQGIPVSMKIEMAYAGEKIYKGSTNEKGVAEIGNTLKDRPYELFVLGEKKKETKKFEINGGKENSIEIDSEQPRKQEQE